MELGELCVETGVSITTRAAAPPTVVADFDDFYRRELAGQVRRAALIVGSTPQANDLVHDAFVSVYRRWSQIADPGPYLNRCVLNACRDALRRRRSLPAAPPEFVGDRTEDVALWDALRRLPERQRTAVVLRYWEGKTEAEIASLLDVKPGTVGPLLTKAMRAIERSWS
jgi:RNA polymerase sigma factor (sigma-70 family)